MNKVLLSIQKDLKPWLPLLKKHGVMLAGGALTSYANNQSPKDWDFYFRSKLQAYDFICALGGDFTWVGKTPRSLVLMHKTNKAIVFNPITFKFYDDLPQVFETFDWNCCKAGYDFATDKLWTAPTFWEDIATKQLTYGTSMFPVSALFRMTKYIKKGYTPAAASVLRLLLDLKSLNLTDPGELAEQVGGLYGSTEDFKGMDLPQIIQCLEEKNVEAGPEFKKVDNEDLMDQLGITTTLKQWGGYVFNYLENRLLSISKNGWDASHNNCEEPLLLVTKTVIGFTDQPTACNFVSRYKPSFNYLLGVEAKDENHGLYFNIGEQTDPEEPTKDLPITVLIEASVRARDIKQIQHGRTIIVTRAMPLRVIKIRKYKDAFIEA